ncbi:adenosylcobinamide-GDP ribazoletransferase [Echinimonas agarilytica]|nr:adenosylcobinamide-GDP ribazoletransferase [Echinimonas agarilytica]
MRYQWHLFLLALAFLTRIPIPASVPFSEPRLNQANRYFALVGTLIGAISASIFLISHTLFSIEVAVVMAMIASLMTTGVFHEDGLADSADGLGGGLTIERKLAIMKDSRIGSYGSAALMMALLMKFAVLSSIPQVVVALIVGHTLSRAVAASLIGAMPYVSESDGSKSKPLANTQSQTDVWFLVVTCAAILLWLPIVHALALVAMCMCVRQMAKIYLSRQIGGYTGDTLGACQQVAELACYLCFALPWFL